MAYRFATVLAASVMLLLGSGVSAFAEGAPAPVTPTLRIPKLLKAPVIDGKIDPEEWKGAAAITGFPNFNGELSLPQALQPVWYMAYDDKNFYLAFHYPVFPAGTLRAACKTKVQAENGDILWDDHTEIEICNTARDSAVSGYFYKFMTNPWDVVSDQKVRWSIGQQGFEYETGTIAKSVFTKDYWDQEIAIPLKDMSVKRIADGDKWYMQLVSAQDSGGNYYTWVPATWLAFHKFPEVIFDSKAAAVQFVGVGDWMNGNPDFTFNLSNSQQTPIDLNLAVKIVDGAGKVVMDQTNPVTLKPGESTVAHVQASGVPLTDIINGRDNRVFFKVSDAHTGALYYENNTALRTNKNVDVQRYIDNLKVSNKPIAPKLEYAYLPSFHRLTVTSDVGILGIDQKLASSAKYLAAWFGTPDGKIIGKNAVPFTADGTAKLSFGFPTLPNGNYNITLQIQDAQSNALTSKTDTFTQQTFPFESFTGGIEETVVKPYTPIKTEGTSFETVGNKITVASNGLVNAVHNKLVPEAAGRDLLAGPVDLVLTQNGQTTKLAGDDKAFAWAPSDVPTKVSGSAENQMGGLTFKINGEAEYTGQYLVNMDIVPNGRADVDRLELEIPLSGRVDTCFANSSRDSIVLYKKDHPYTGEPADGELWNNLSERNVRPYIMYVGDGERGLYWYTDSYEGFWIDDNKPNVSIVKRGKETILKVAFINKSVVIDHPRHIRFALLPVPTKPLPADAREMQWSGRMHIGGASWWGTIGCFVFPFNDEQWQNWIAGKPFIWNGKPYPGQCALLPAPPMDANGKWLLQKGHEYGSYRAADMIGYLQPELKVYSGEWCGVTNPALSPDGSLLGYQDAKHNPVWPEPEQRGICGKDPCLESSYDYEAYYFYLMAKNTGAGGYWWDWGSFATGHSLDEGEMYLNDEGKPEPRTNLFMVRNFYERVARIVQDLDIPDTNNCYAPGAVYQMPWLTRINAWESLYLESDLDDMFDAWGVDRYRMQIGKFSGIPVQNVMNLQIDFKNPRARTVLALALLYDNGVCGADGDRAGMEELRKAGIFDEAAEWVPHWRSEPIVSSTEKELLISGYKLDGGKRLTLVIVNSGQTDLTTTLTVPGFENAKTIDAETGATIGSGTQVSDLVVKHHDFRLITLEK